MNMMKLKQIAKARYLNILTVNSSRAPCLLSCVLSDGGKLFMERHFNVSVVLLHQSYVYLLNFEMQSWNVFTTS